MLRYDSTAPLNPPRESDRFTLLELYVVVLIIMIVASLLIPSAIKSKTYSLRSACTYNLRTIGMALALYESEFEIYPVEDPVVEQLYSEQFLKLEDNRCPLDRTEDGDTYSYGYLGGHPGTIRDDDPLVVCGWHRRIGSLAVFSDTSVGDLNGNKSGATLPVTVMQGTDSVEPRMVLHDKNAMVVSGTRGDDALIYGNDGAYYIAAGYDPMANNGYGEFTVALGFDPKSKTSQSFSGHTPYSYVRFYSRLKYTNVEVTSDPKKPQTSITWSPQDDISEIGINDFGGYRMTHRITGETRETRIANPRAAYEVSNEYMFLKGP